MAEQKLMGKTALVTGGSRGLGAAAARRLAREGADAAITYVHTKDKAEAVVGEPTALGVRAAAFQADQGKPDEVIGTVSDVADRFGRSQVVRGEHGGTRQGHGLAGVAHRLDVSGTALLAEPRLGRGVAGLSGSAQLVRPGRGRIGERAQCERARDLGPVRAIVAGPRRPARHLAALPESVVGPGMSRTRPMHPGLRPGCTPTALRCTAPDAAG